MIRKAFFIPDAARFDPTRPVPADAPKVEQEGEVVLGSLQDLIRHVVQPEVELFDVEASENPPGRFRHPETHQAYRVLMDEPGGVPLLTNP